MANDVYELQILGATDGEPWENILHFEADVANAADPLQDADRLITGFRADIENALIDPLPDTTTIHGYKAKRINNTGGPNAVRPVAGVVGGQAAQESTTGVTACLIWPYTTGAAWRAGRTFLAAIDSSNLVGNIFSPGIQALITTLIAQILGGTTFGGVNFSFVIWRHLVSVAVTPLGGSLSLKPGVQNRRMKPAI